MATLSQLQTRVSMNGRMTAVSSPPKFDEYGDDDVPVLDPIEILDKLYMRVESSTGAQKLLHAARHLRRTRTSFLVGD